MKIKRKTIAIILILACMLLIGIGCDSSKNAASNNKKNISPKNTSKSSKCNEADCNMTNCTDGGNKQDSMENTGLETTGTTKTIKINGMKCAQCIKRVKASLGKIDGVKIVKVDIGIAVINVTKNVDDVTIKNSIEKNAQGKDTGYKVLGIS